MFLHRDYETRSNANLPKVGVDKYAADPSTEVLCAAYAVDDGPVQVWLPGREPIPAVFFEAERDLSWEVSAHNDAFETAIERHILAPRFGFPLVPLERHSCTMARCQALALPAKLEAVADVAGAGASQGRCRRTADAANGQAAPGGDTRRSRQAR